MGMELAQGTNLGDTASVISPPSPVTKGLQCWFGEWPSPFQAKAECGGWQLSASLATRNHHSSSVFFHKTTVHSQLS